MRPSTLSPERWRRIDGVLDAALATPPAEREAFLAAACAEDEALRSEVEALLEAHARVGDSFDRVATSLGASILTSLPEDEPGELEVGPFRILSEIGRGGMGVVYLAEDTRLGRRVALKALPPYLGTGPEAKERFRAEARAVSALDHPNVVTLHEIDVTPEGQLYMVFAFYEGETLDEVVARGPVSADRAREIAQGIAAGLGAAHRRGIIHRDVKPSNVLLTRQGHVKLLDFGVAKMVGEEITGAGVRLGTVAYMSPEQASGGDVDARTDLWSLGVVLYTVLTGRRPFHGDDQTSLIRSICQEAPEPLESAGVDVPAGLARIVGKLLSKPPDGRYGSADELLADLRDLASGRPPSVALRDPPTPGPSAITRVAVLPLTNLTGDPDARYLVDGIHADLIAELGRAGGWSVISRTSVLRYRDTEESMAAIARELEVDALVEGHVSREGEALTLRIQLVATSPERTLWAGHRQTDIGDAAAVAAAMARSLLQEVGRGPAAVPQARPAPRPQVDPAAWEAYNRGKIWLESRSPEGHELARRFLTEAIRIDPRYAPAYAELAEAIGSAAFFGLVEPTETVPGVKELAETALQLDGRLPEAHAVTAMVRLLWDRDWAGAEASARRALALNPSYAEAHRVLAEVLSVQGRYDEALTAVERGSELDRWSHFAALRPAVVLYYRREFDRALERARAGLELFPGFWQGYWVQCLALSAMARHDRAVTAGEEAVARSRRTAMALGALGFALARGERREAALAVIEELETRAEREYVAGLFVASVYSGLDDPDGAFRWLDRAVRQRDLMLVELNNYDFLGPLHDDARWLPLLRQVGLERA